MFNKSLLRYVVYIASTIAVAVVLGIFLAGQMRRDRDRKRTEAIRVLSANVIERMQNVQVGRALPDQWFLLDDSTTTRLTRMLRGGPNAICFIELSCDVCKEELELISELDDNIQKKIVFISHDDPDSLSIVRSLANLRSPVLYDPHGRYFRQLNVSTYPLTIFVDSNGVVEGVHASYLTKQDIDAKFGSDD